MTYLYFIVIERFILRIITITVLLNDIIVRGNEWAYMIQDRMY